MYVVEMCFLTINMFTPIMFDDKVNKKYKWPFMFTLQQQLYLLLIHIYNFTKIYNVQEVNLLANAAPQRKARYN